MDPPDLEPREALDVMGGPSESEPPSSEAGPPGETGGSNWLDEIVARLEDDPDECWPAIEALAELDEEVRAQVLAMLAAHGDRPGIHRLLHLIGSVHDSAVPIEAPTALPIILADRAGGGLVGGPDRPLDRIVRSLVTAVDGDGRGMIMISSRDRGHRRTAVFSCDVSRGILDAVGEVEVEHASASRLIDEWVHQADGDYVLDVPELAVRLLGGALAMSGPQVPGPVRAWLDATISPGISVPASSATFPAPDLDATPDHDTATWVDLVLDACPAWLDRSALTYELADEIALREGTASPDPIRDVGAYRYLFEHRLIGRLDLYARMLLWMAWLWHAAGRVELSRSAFALGGELSEQQHAVPSHPFTVSLTTRSLRTAQAELRRAAAQR
jgi:hypothetical protein